MGAFGPGAPPLSLPSTTARSAHGAPQLTTPINNIRPRQVCSGQAREVDSCPEPKPNGCITVDVPLLEIGFTRGFGLGLLPESLIGCLAVDPAAQVQPDNAARGGFAWLPGVGAGATAALVRPEPRERCGVRARVSRRSGPGLGCGVCHTSGYRTLVPDFGIGGGLGTSTDV